MEDRQSSCRVEFGSCLRIDQYWTFKSNFDDAATLPALALHLYAEEAAERLQAALQSIEDQGATGVRNPVAFAEVGANLTQLTKQMRR